MSLLDRRQFLGKAQSCKISLTSLRLSVGGYGD
jgi:hypothetical protein